MSEPKFVGDIINNAHPATPVVIGDFELMKEWPGDIDGGSDGAALIGEPKPDRLVFFPYIECVHERAPSVFATPDATWITSCVAAEHTSEPQWADAPFAPRWRGVIAVPSGGLVIALAYDRTPAHDADTSEWDEDDNYLEDLTPHLPAAVPTEPVYLGEQLVVLPVAPGFYEVAGDYVEPLQRCRITATSEAAFLEYVDGLDLDDLFSFE